MSLNFPSNILKKRLFFFFHAFITAQNGKDCANRNLLQEKMSQFKTQNRNEKKKINDAWRE